MSPTPETWLCYRPLTISPLAPLRVADFIRNPVEWTLQDVRDILRLPMPSLGLTAGCNFTIANALLNHVAGLATVFFDAAGEPRARFIGMMRDFYPWHLERFLDNDIDENSGPPILYDLVRNPFAHSLGIDTKIVGGPRETKRVVRRFRSRDFRIGIGRTVRIDDGSGLTVETLSELDGDPRPLWLAPTINREHDGVVLSCEALYRGVRLMIEALAREERTLKHAEAFLKHSEDDIGPAKP